MEHIKNIYLYKALEFYGKQIADKINSTNSEYLKTKLQAKFKLIDLLFKGYDKILSLRGTINIPEKFKEFLENQLEAICNQKKSNCNLFYFVENKEKIKKFANELYTTVKLFEELKGGYKSRGHKSIQKKSKKVF